MERPELQNGLRIAANTMLWASGAAMTLSGMHALDANNFSERSNSRVQECAATLGSQRVTIEAGEMSQACIGSYDGVITLSGKNDQLQYSMPSSQELVAVNTIGSEEVTAAQNRYIKGLALSAGLFIGAALLRRRIGRYGKQPLPHEMIKADINYYKYTDIADFNLDFKKFMDERQK